MNTTSNRRILIVDDTPSIHNDFRKILGSSSNANLLDSIENTLFGTDNTKDKADFELDSAYQGQEALQKVCTSLETNLPYALAFVDMRMPPGWDGVETIERLWQRDPRLQIVICTAYTDYSWDEVFKRLSASDRLLILKKPFDPVEVLQFANALTVKWLVTEQAALKMNQLEDIVAERTSEIRQINSALQNEIVERKRNEDALKLAASVFQNAMDAIMIIDTQSYIISVNPAFCKMTGYAPNEAIGVSASMLRAPQEKINFNSDVMSTLAQTGHWEGEIWNKHKNGSTFFTRLTIGAVSAENGSVARYVGIFNDITELHRKDEHIQHLAFHDALTDLPNRALLLDRLEYNIELSQRENNAPLSVMLIDLDRFKSINDSLGHDIGDALLIEVASRLKICLRSADTVARLGGDEFAVIIKLAGGPEVYASLAERVLESFSNPIVISGHSMQVSASIGISCFPEDGKNVVELMKHADAAMYAAKAAGRNAYCFFRPAMTERANQRLQLEMALRKAAQKGELELFYQPKMVLGSRDVCGVEALIRWRHPVMGLIPPGDFISIAEETGIIGELGDWVLEEACRQSAAWKTKGLDYLKIAVNISAKQLQQNNLVERILDLTKAYRIEPNDLEIELTESVVMAHPEQMTVTLERLRAIGCSIAVDDFGTGYSSLAYLRRLPIDVLKIDRSFVMNADRDAGDAEVVKIILALAQALKLGVVAEGVETESQATFLRVSGCNTAQGYLYSKPVPAQQLETWLQERKNALATSA